VTDELRQEAVGALASRISAWPGVRDALRGRQLAFRRLPGLVADGRDMGSVIFPGATLKVFLTAGVEQRAARRHNQLISKGISSTMEGLRVDLEARDRRDRERTVAPCTPAADALLLDNSALSVEASVQRVLGWWHERWGPQRG
jgi:3-phosphoshikimate 1-carboxyvinyltransferase